jgi:transcriptional regulator with XRE-family HTH domain
MSIDNLLFDQMIFKDMDGDGIMNLMNDQKKKVEKVSLGYRLQQKRRGMKLTQKQVAKTLGVDHTTISKWEANIYEPDTTMLLKLAELYESSIDDLLGRPPGLHSIHTRLTKNAKSLKEMKEAYEAGELTFEEKVAAIVDKAGEPGSTERIMLKELFEEFSKLPDSAQKTVMDLIKQMPKKE